MGIGVLGPLTIEGDRVLSPRDRVVLAALALSIGESVSAERLADALWGDRPPASAAKILQGCIVRLRKSLGAASIETTSHGYRLAVPPDDVDARRFERLLRRGQELVTLGEPEHAAYTIDEALRLWRGGAFVDLEDWAAGQVEAGRLEELRLEAEDVRLDAALRAGKYVEVLAEIRTRVAAAPLRERRWALLATAQYQAGRQGDALRSLREARRMLVDELGIDPGPDLVALEQAILHQDPALVAASVLPAPSTACPYLGLVPYDVADADGFFGRNGEVEACLSRLAAVGVLAVVGPSGSGKSSLVRAGVAASLQRDGRRVVVVSPGARPMETMSALPSSGPAPVLVVDQCEEAVTLCDDPAAQASFFAALVAHAGRGPLVIALRADRLGELSAHTGFSRLVEPGLHLLSAMSEAELRAAIEGPARQVGLLLEPGLVDLLVREVAGEPGALPLLSHALHETWQRREGRTLTVGGYQDTGGIRGAVAQSAEEVYNQIDVEQRALLRDLLLRLVTPTPEGEPVRSRVPRRTVATDAEHERLVELLVHARLVTSDDDTVELAHESLARAWPRLQTWLDDDVEGQRILRHLALTADAWHSMGRPDGELYRGARLAQALEWRTQADPDLTPTERTFLDSSAEREREETAKRLERLRQQARQNRRLRALLAGVAVLLVVALVAGVVAVRQANRADRSAVAADARRVGAQALVADDIDRSLLLAVEGVRLENSPDTRANLLAALKKSPELIASIRTDERVLISVEVSPDGTVVGVGEAYGAVSFYDTSTRDLLGTYNEIPVWKFEFRGDGEQLAVSGQPDPTSGTPLAQPSVRLVDAATFDDEPVQLGGIPESEYPSAPHYSADGRFLSATFENAGGGENTSVVVWDLAAPQQPVLQFDVPAYYGVELSPDGSQLYVGEWDRPAVTVYEVATGRTLRSASVPAASLEISPDGSLLAAGDGNDIVLIDATTLTEVRRLQGHSDSLQVIRFSPSGALLASGSDDRTVIVWDVTTGKRREALTGHDAAVWGVGFSPDSDTLYTAGGRTVLTWDLTGQRRFIARYPLPERDRHDWALASPTGDAVAYIGPTNELQFVDLKTGPTGPLLDAGHGSWGWFSWRSDGDRFATAGDDGFVRVWDWHTGRVITARHIAPMHISAVDYTGDGRRLVIVERTGTTYTIDAETLQPDGTPVQIAGEIVNVYASPDNRTAVVLTTDHFSLVDLDNGGVLHDGDAPDASSGEFSPDGTRFAIGGQFGEVRVLDVNTGAWVGPSREGHTGEVVTVDYAPDGATFGTGGDDGAIVLWDADSGALLNRVLPGRPDDGWMSPRFLPDGHTVLIAAFAGAVYTMDTRPEHWVEFACAIAGRNLTEDEWSAAFGDQPYRETCPADSDPDAQLPG